MSQIQPPMLHWVMCLIFLIFTWTVNAVEVVFIEADDPAGNLIQLEPGGRFYHVAIRYKGRWLHANPHKGVDLVDSLEDYGHRFFSLMNPLVPEPDPGFVNHWLGKNFDRSYRWDNPSATYCTRLVAEILGVPPQRMSFGANHWDKYSDMPAGEVGLSPDELYKDLLKRGFKPLVNCAAKMESR